jgi:hypothetical protein
MTEQTDEELQSFYDKYKNYQCDVVTISLNLCDLVRLVRTVDINKAIEND